MDLRLQALLAIDKALDAGKTYAEFELPETVESLDMLARFVSDGCGLGMTESADGEIKRYRLTWGKDTK